MQQAVGKLRFPSAAGPRIEDEQLQAGGRKGEERSRHSVTHCLYSTSCCQVHTEKPDLGDAAPLQN